MGVASADKGGAACANKFAVEKQPSNPGRANQVGTNRVRVIVSERKQVVDKFLTSS